MKKIKIIFCGTPDFATTILQALLADKAFEILAVFTQEDKPVGRGKKVQKSAVKLLAEKQKIKIYQAKKIKDELESIKKLQADVIIVAAYGQIIPSEILAIPAGGCLNVHASLLPRHRGASPINAALLHGDKKTGVCIMKMDQGLDTGDVLSCQEVNIETQETATTLHDKLALLGAELLAPTIKKYLQGKIKPKKQKKTGITYAKKIKKEDGYLDFSQKAQELERKIRAYNPWPGTYAYLNTDLPKERLLFKILAVRPQAISTSKYFPGELFMYHSALAVKCGDKKALVIIKLQIEGKKAMDADNFLRGKPGVVGMFLE